MSRVLLVGRGPPERGGISAYMLGLQNGPLAGEHQMRLLNLTRKEAPPGGRLTGRNVTRTFTDTFALLRAPSADIVHINTALVPTVTLVRAALLVLAGRVRLRKVVLHVHSGKVQLWLTNSVRRSLVKVALAGAHRVVAVSEGAHEALRSSVSPKRLRNIPNGVDVERFGPPEEPHDPPRILYVGLLTPRKGVIDLFAASRMLHKRGVDHQVVVAGGTPDEGPGAEAEVRAAAPPEIELVGSRPHEDMIDLYRSADVFCLPSWWEAMPLTVLEAMATGLPVVATNVGDISSMLGGGTAGELVPARNPLALANALEKFLTDPGLRRQHGTEGRRRAETAYAIEANAAAVGEIYEDLNPRGRRTDL